MTVSVDLLCSVKVHSSWWTEDSYKFLTKSSPSTSQDFNLAAPK